METVILYGDATTEYFNMNETEMVGFLDYFRNNI